MSIFHKSGSRGPGPHPKVPTRHQHGPQGYQKGAQGYPKGAQGCRNEAPRSPQSAKKAPNYTPCVSKWKPKVPQWSQKNTQSAKQTPQGLSKYHEDPKIKKTCTYRPRPGARRRRRRSGRGSKGRPTRLHVETPVAERKQRIEVQVTRALFLYSNNWVLALTPTPRNEAPGAPQKTSKKR